MEKPTDPDGLILEAWAQGYMVGSLIIMACITSTWIGLLMCILNTILMLC